MRSKTHQSDQYQTCSVLLYFVQHKVNEKNCKYRVLYLCIFILCIYDLFNWLFAISTEHLLRYFYCFIFC
jgi:hypothetical protein